MVSPLAGRRVYADTSVFIYAFEASSRFPRLQTEFLDPFTRGEFTLVTSWISFAEALIRPLQTGNTVEEAGYRAFFVPSAHFEILPVDGHIADQAAAIRATHRLKLPDAIHIATGMAAGCDFFLTGDGEWAKTGVQVIEAEKL